MKICISGFAGCGKTTVAERLSALTGFQKLNITFKDLAKDKGITLEQLQKLAEKDNTIDKQLDALIVKMAKELGNVIISTWLCPWTIKDADIRVFLDASIAERARRIAKRERISYAKALAGTKKRDAQNVKRYKKLYSIDIRDTKVYDILLNTEKVNPGEAAELIKSLADSRARKN